MLKMGKSSNHRFYYSDVECLSVIHFAKFRGYYQVGSRGKEDLCVYVEVTFCKHIKTKPNLPLLLFSHLLGTCQSKYLI